MSDEDKDQDQAQPQTPSNNSSKPQEFTEASQKPPSQPAEQKPTESLPPLTPTTDFIIATKAVNQPSKDDADDKK